MQNKDGNGTFNLRWTTAGSSLVNELNNDTNNNIRELLFGTQDTINYNILAGKLRSETVAIKKAKEIINPDNDSNIMLTINQFTRSRSSLSSLALKNMLNMEQFEKSFIHTNHKLHQEKMQFENKLACVKNKTKEMKTGITSKIKEIRSSSCNTLFAKTIATRSSNEVVSTVPTLISQY